MKSIRERSQWICLGVMIALMSFSGATWADQAPSANHTAVLDFIWRKPSGSGENLESREDPTLGVADFFEDGLGKRGVGLIERRSIWPVLSERRLRRALADEKLDLPGLPGLTSAVTGSMEYSDPDHVRLHVALVRMSDAGEIDSFDINFEYPKGLSAAVDSAAKRVAEHLSSGRPAPSGPPRHVYGFTENPEAAMYFYRGLDELAHSHDALAIACFIQAIEIDSEFDLAVAWEIRAMKRAGLGDFARPYQEYREKTGSPGELAMGQMLRSFEPSQDTMVILAPMDGVGPEAVEAFRKVWGRTPGVQLFDPKWIDRVAGERDLKLSGEFDALPTSVDRWLFAQVGLWLGRDRAMVFDIVNGKPLASIERGRETDDAKVAALLLQQWRSAATQPGGPESGPGVSSIPAAPAPHPTDEPWNIEKKSIAQGPSEMVERFNAGPIQRDARVFQALIDKPNDLRVLKWCMKESWTIEVAPAAIDRMIRVIGLHPDLPDASAWLMFALHERNEWKFHFDTTTEPFVRFEREPPIAVRFKEMFDWFPQSREALLLKIGLAYELLGQGKTVEAVAMLEDFMARWKQYSNVLTLNDEAMLASVQLELARAHFRLGHLAAARQWFDPVAARVAQKKWGLIWVRMAMHFPNEGSSASFLNHWDHYRHRQVWDDHVEELNDARYSFNALKNHLEQAEAGQEKPGPYLDSADLMLAAINAPTPELMYSRHLESVRAYLDERDTELSLPRRVMEQLAWLRCRARTPVEVSEIELLIDKVNNRSFPHVVGDEYRLMAMAGQFDQAYAELSTAANDVNAGVWGSTRCDQLLQLIELESAACSPAELGRRIHHWLDVFDQAVRAPDGKFKPNNYKYDLYRLYEAVAPVLLDIGEPDEAARRLQVIVDDKDLPEFYRQRAEYRLALAEAQAGRVAEGVERLRKVELALGEMGDGEYKWDVPESRSYIVYGYRALAPTKPEELSGLVNYSLHRLRLFSGQPVLSQIGRPSEFDAAFSPSQEEIAQIVAFAFPLRAESEYADWQNKGYWQSAAQAELERRGNDAVPLLHRLLLCQTYSQKGFDTRRHTAYYALSTLASLGPSMQPSVDLLLRWLVWSHICEFKKHAARSLEQIGRDDGRIAPVLALGAGMVGGCEVEAHNALWKMRLDPRSRPGLDLMLDHPRFTTRQHAGDAVSRLMGIRLPVDDQGLPLDQGLAGLLALRGRTGSSPTPSIADRPDPGRVYVGAIYSVSIDPERRTIIASRGGESSLWMTKWDDFERPVEIPVAAAEAPACAWQANVVTDLTHRQVAALGQDMNLRVWSLDPIPRQVARFQVERERHLSFSPDGRLLFTQHRADLIGIEIATSRIVARLPLPGGMPVFRGLSKDGDQVLITNGDGGLLVLDLQTGKILHRLDEAGDKMETSQWLTNQRVLLAMFDGTVRVWDLSKDQETLRITVPEASGLTAVASRDGCWIVTGVSEGEIRVWDATTGKIQRVLPVMGKGVYSLRFADDGHLWNTATDGRIKVWDIEAGRILEDRSMDPPPRVP